MNQRLLLTLNKAGGLLCAAGVFLLGSAGADTTTGGLNLATAPLYVTTNVAPIVMLNVTKDHQLYFKAYNDYTDLDSDGTMDTSYRHSFNYYGYFDYGKCYKYDTSNGYYYPFALTTDKYCTSGDNQWSGNFLNWVAMSRIDVLRKVLYGGTRYTDTATLTVLERTLLPTDAHAWVKFYGGSDINRLTPFSAASAAVATTATAPTIWGTAGDAERSVDVPITDTGSSGIDAQIGDQVTVVSPSGARTMKGMVTFVETNVKITLRVPASSFSGPVDTSESGTWTLTNHTRVGASFCNVTYAYNAVSQSVDTGSNPPLIRAVRGDYSLWAANERQQCLYASERGDTLGGEQKNNGNRIGLSGMAASAKNPPLARGLFSVLSSASDGKPDFIARVKVCVAALIGNESCRRYDTAEANNLKPVGLLQEFGEGSSPSMRFGLMTGSYDKNISGGVLRRGAMESLAKSGYADNEINPANGTFTTAVGIVRTIDKLRMYGYQYFGGTGVSDGYMNTDGCDYQQMGMTTGTGGGSGEPAPEGKCSTWGNPIGELYLESLRYLAGQTSPTDAYYAAAPDKDNALGLPRATWTDPLSSSTYCTPLTALVVNSSSITFDDDQYAGVIDIGSSLLDLTSKTNAVGAAELVAGQQVSVGNNGSTDDSVCTSKEFGTLSALAGICPESPALKGTYKIAGLAYRARTNPIRSFGANVVPASDTTSLKVSTYAVQLASATPVINVTVNGKPVVITPTYRLDRNGHIGGGALVDFRPIGIPDNTSGKFYLAWEDSSAGGDYDQDVWGLLSYTVSGNNIYVRTQVIAQATANPQGFGFTIQGTDRDGAHFYSGVLNFNFQDGVSMSGRLTFDDGTAPVVDVAQINNTGGCRNCNAGAPAITGRFAAQAAVSGSKTLQDPLYYAAKWGGFSSAAGTTEASTDTPTSTSMTWDVVDNLTGVAKTSGQYAPGDNLPDQYFYVINPTKLQDALRLAFRRILAKGSSSGVAANSYSLNTDNAIYQAGFNSTYWSGYLLSEPLNVDGTLTSSTTDGWHSDNTITTATLPAASRVVYTFDPTLSAPDGISFTWAALNTAQKAILNGSDNLGSDRVDFLRGSAVKEGTTFRSRKSLLSDIVNSSPTYVGPPTGRYEYPLNLFNEVYLGDSSYDTWRTSKMARTRMLYVGANDGMLHGVAAANDTANGITAGHERLAYIPSFLFSKLPAQTALNYTHQYTVDGSPTVADVKFTSGWRSVLVSGVGAGGRGVFALDVSDPAQFTGTNAAAIALWEFSSSNDADLGYTLSKPLIVKTNNGKWAAIFGNGYFRSGDTVTTGRAKLFILDIEAGADGTWASGDYKVIDTGVGDIAAPNGLGHVVAFDKDLDGDVDEVYGGDLKGNLWKFDLSGSNANNWDVAYRSGNTPKPVITVCADPTSTAACNASLLPITLRPTVTFHPTGQSSNMVYFGTGKYLEQSDHTDTSKGWVFGVWDNSTNGALGLLSDLTAAQRNTQTITTLPLTTGAEFKNRDVTDIVENWTVHKLWREQLPEAGERMTGTPRLLGGVLFYTTYIPSSEVCKQEGTGYLMGVRFQNGGKVSYSVFDSNGDGQVNASDTSLLGGVGISPTVGDVALIKTPGRGDATVKVYINDTKGNISIPPLGPRSVQTRVSWKELFRE